MKKIINYFSRYAWLYMLIAILLLFPQALSSQARLNNRVLITGIAVDKVSDGYEVTAQVVLPFAGSEAGGEGAVLDFITEKGASIVEGLKKISYNIGEIAGLSHTNFIVLGSSMFNDNLISDIDYFLRDAQLPNSVMVVFSNGSAKDTIERTGDLDISAGIGLQKVFLYKEESLNSKMIPLSDFILGAYSPSTVSVLPELNISIEGEEENGSETSSQKVGIKLELADAPTKSESSSGGQGGSGGESSSSSGGSNGGSSSGGEESRKQGRIKFFTPFCYFKNGEFVDVITDQDEIIGYLLTQNKTKQFDLVISGVNDDEIYYNASVGVRVNKMKSGITLDFLGDKPKANISVELDKIRIIEVNSKNFSFEGSYTTLKPYANDTLKNAIKDKVSNSIKSVFEDAQRNNADIYKVADYAEKFYYDDWKNYLSSLPNIDDYILNFDLSVNVEIKNFT